MRLKTALLVAALCIAAPAALFPQTVSQVVNTVAVGGITGLGTGVATLLGGNSSGTGGPAGTTSPTFTTPVLGAATATSINFGGTTFNTYVAGTWTPTLIGSSTPGTGQTYSLQTGNYEQIGRQVTVRFAVVATSLGTAAGNMIIGGLPVNVATATGFCFISSYLVTGLAALNYGVVGLVLVANPNQIALSSNSNTATNSLTVAQAGSSVQLQGYCSYQAS